MNQEGEEGFILKLEEDALTKVTLKSITHLRNTETAYEQKATRAARLAASPVLA
jgi:hypothetical protein